MPDILVIGGGHNALVAAFYLAKAGRKPLVLERRPMVGGCAVTEEFAPGYKAPTLAHTFGPLRDSIVRDLHLERRGVQFIRPDPRLVSLGPDGKALVFSTDVQRTSEAIREFSPVDADKYPQFCATLGRLGGFLGTLLEMTPPSIDAPSGAELWTLLKTGRRFRALGKKDGFSLLRWGPMAVADLVAEWFETDLLQGSVASRGVFGTSMGPWSAGSGAVLLLAAASDPVPGGSSITAVGGPGAVTAAMAQAAIEAGAEIRTGAEVERVLIREGSVRGVTLADGTELSASAVVSAVDPRRTFLGLIDPMDLDPGFITRIRNYRVPGTVAKVNVALRGLPIFRGLKDSSASALRGRVIVAPSVDYLEHAYDASKYGEVSASPYLDITFPSVVDATMAPAGRHVMSVYMQYAPYRLRNGISWASHRDALGDIVLRTLDEHAPGTSALVEHRQVLTPADFEETFGLTGGHIFHGELSLDQLFTMRPTLGWGQYASPVANLYLCGSGTHPGTGLTGGSGQNAAREILRHLKRP
jgi:phytoene dehydrogenase-like protein